MSHVVPAFPCTDIPCPKDHFCAVQKFCVPCTAVCRNNGTLCQELCKGFNPLEYLPKEPEPNTVPTGTSIPLPPVSVNTSNPTIELNTSEINDANQKMYLSIIVLLSVIIVFLLIYGSRCIYRIIRKYLKSKKKLKSTQSDSNVPAEITESSVLIEKQRNSSNVVPKDKLNCVTVDKIETVVEPKKTFDREKSAQNPMSAVAWRKNGDLSVQKEQVINLRAMVANAQSIRPDTPGADVRQINGNFDNNQDENIESLPSISNNELSQGDNQILESPSRAQPDSLIRTNTAVQSSSGEQFAIHDPSQTGITYTRTNSSPSTQLRPQIGIQPKQPPAQPSSLTPVHMPKNDLLKRMPSHNRINELSKSSSTVSQTLVNSTPVLAQPSSTVEQPVQAHVPTELNVTQSATQPVLSQDLSQKTNSIRAPSSCEIPNRFHSIPPGASLLSNELLSKDISPDEAAKCLRTKTEPSEHGMPQDATKSEELSKYPVLEQGSKSLNENQMSKYGLPDERNPSASPNIAVPSYTNIEPDKWDVNLPIEPVSNVSTYRITETSCILKEPKPTPPSLQDSKFQPSTPAFPEKQT